MKQAWGNIQDVTKVSIARINSDYKDLDVAIVKATNHVEAPPKEKHVRTIFAYTSASRPRADIAYCIHQIGKRLGKTHNWCVALKCLMVIHRTLREGDPTFREELINYDRRGRTLNMANFKDDSGPAAWDYSAWVRTYALFLEERLECFRVLKYDVEAEKSSGHSQTREVDTPELLDHLPALQCLLHRLVGCQPEGSAVGSHVIQSALRLVLNESFKLYRAINDGIINLVDKFFDMSRVDASKALAIYKRASEQAEKLSAFYDMCKTLDVARNMQFPTLEQPPQSFLSTMEEYVRDAPRSSAPAESYSSHSESRKPEPLERKERREVRRTTQEEEAPPPPPPPPPPPEQEPAPPPPPPPAPAPVQDLLDVSVSMPHQVPSTASQMEEQNALALAIVPANAQTAPPLQANGSATSGWELALVTAPSATATAAPDASASSSLAGGFDKLTLDSLYDDALRRSSGYQSGYATSTNPPAAPSGMLALPAPPGASFNPGMPAMGMQQGGGAPGMGMGMGGGGYDPFAASRNVAPPPNVQMAAMAHQQHQLGVGMHGAPSVNYQQAPGMGMGMGMGGMPGGYGAGMGYGGPPGGMAPAVNPFANPYGAANPYSAGGGMAPAPAAGNPFGSNSLL